MRNIRDFLEFMRNPSDSFDMMTMMVAKSREEDVADDGYDGSLWGYLKFYFTK